MWVVTAFALAAATTPQGFEPSGRWARTTSELAVDLLTPEQAADAVSHKYGWPIFQNGAPSSIRFVGRATETGDGFCIRKSYYVPIISRGGKADAPAEAEPAIAGNEIRVGGCDGIFAALNRGATLEDGKAVLNWLAWARATTGFKNTPTIAISCRDEVNHKRCDAGARAALAALPLDKAIIITRDYRRAPHRWNVAITETQPGQTQPGQLYWDVQVDATPGQEAIDLVWKAPPPF